MRLFIAIRFTEAFKKPILDFQTALRERGVKGNYTRPENLHLTLAFIGETNRADDIKAAMREVPFEPFLIETGKPGCFKGRKDIIWLGINGGEKMEALADQLRDKLDAHGIDYSRVPFKPHITLVRHPSRTPLNIDIQSERMTVGEMSLMKSEHVKGLLVYTAVE